LILGVRRLGCWGAWSLKGLGVWENLGGFGGLERLLGRAGGLGKLGELWARSWELRAGRLVSWEWGWWWWKVGGKERVREAGVLRGD